MGRVSWHIPWVVEDDPWCLEVLLRSPGSNAGRYVFVLGGGASGWDTSGDTDVLPSSPVTLDSGPDLVSPLGTPSGAVLVWGDSPRSPQDPSS